MVSNATPPILARPLWQATQYLSVTVIEGGAAAPVSPAVAGCSLADWAGDALWAGGVAASAQAVARVAGAIARPMASLRFKPPP